MAETSGPISGRIALRLMDGLILRAPRLQIWITLLLQILTKYAAWLTSDISCASGTIVNSNVLTFNVGHSTSGGRLYPNPSNGKFTIDNLLPGDNWENLTIASADGGKTIATINIVSSTSVHVNVSYLQRGFYLVTLHRREGKRKIFKLIKQ